MTRDRIAEPSRGRPGNLFPQGEAPSLGLMWWTRWRTPILVFLVSRAGLLVLAWLSLRLVPLPANPNWDWWPCPVFGSWARWDSGWYLRIASQGYTNIPDQDQHVDVKYFPLYPLLIRGLGWLTGNLVLAGAVISHLAFLAATVGVYEMVRRRSGEELARRTVILMCVYPFSFYYSAVYAEALFLAAAVGAFYFGEQRRWLPAALCASMAAVTRVPGVLVGLALVPLYLESIGFEPRRLRPDLLWLSLAALLPAAHMAYLWVRFDDPLLLIHSHHVTLQRTRLAAFQLAAPAAAGAYRAGVLNASFFPLGVAGCGWALLRGARVSAAWGLAYLLMSVVAWYGMGRYVGAVYPMFWAWAQVLPSRAYWAAAAVSATLLALLTILFAHWVYLG